MHIVGEVEIYCRDAALNGGGTGQMVEAMVTPSSFVWGGRWDSGFTLAQAQGSSQWGQQSHLLASRELDTVKSNIAALKYEKRSYTKIINFKIIPR